MEPTYETPQERADRLKLEQKERKKTSSLQAKARKKVQEKKDYEEKIQKKISDLHLVPNQVTFIMA
ncbi:MAG: hypothetical protein HRU09_18285 [Oligoflexales bacterium]|nr:hypothetical protein [Oligoflexales bacterium]